MFDNPVLEKLTRSHFSIPLLILLGISVTLSYLALTEMSISVATFSWIFVVGFFSWTLGEYLIRRHVFHMGDESRWKRWISYTFHGVHHEYPKDKDRIIMPPIGALLIASLLFGIFWLVMRDYAFAFTPGFLIGYMIYAFIHYAIHAYQPPKNVFKWLWIYHGIHHYKHPDRYFGVSSPIWDYVFKSTAKKKQ